MPGHVEGNDAEVFGELFIRKKIAPLPLSEPAVCRQTSGMPWPASSK
jgi:hypothetical protein